MNKSATSKEALLEIARDISYREGISKVSIQMCIRDRVETGPVCGWISGQNLRPGSAACAVPVSYTHLM